VLIRFAYLKKRDDLTMESFIDYYETHHVPLVLSLAPPPLVYKRHYLMRGDEFSAGEDDLDFDVVAEFAWADRSAQEAWIAAIGAAADRVAADEANFLDRSRLRSVLIEQRVTAG
jgi:hypothetical protein